MTTESQPSPSQVPLLPTPAPTPTADPSPSGSASQTASATVPTQPTGAESSPGAAGFGNIADLSAEEFNSPGVAKLMFRQIVSLAAEVRQKAPFETLYHDERVNAAKLQGDIDAQARVNPVKDQLQTLSDICFGVFLFAAGVVASDAYAATNDKATDTLYTVAGALVVIAIAAKLYAADVFKKKRSKT